MERNLFVVFEKSYADRTLEDALIVGVYDDFTVAEDIAKSRAQAYARATQGLVVKAGKIAITVEVAADGAPVYTLLIAPCRLNQTEG